MITATDFVRKLIERNFSFYSGVPCSFLTPLMNYILKEPQAAYYGMANEGDAVALASGAALTGKKTVVMMQNSGLGNAVNPLTSLNHTFSIPILLIITQRGNPNIQDEPQHQLMGKITREMLELMEIPCLPFPNQTTHIQSTIEKAEAMMHKTHRPVALIMQKGDVAKEKLTEEPLKDQRATHSIENLAFNKPVKRSDVLNTLLHNTNTTRDVIIATTGYTGRELYALSDQENHFYMIGSMGCASALGLGIACAKPEKNVIIVDGDGAALMRMGNFAALGRYGESKIIHLLLDNGVHESTGSQPSLATGVHFPEIAKACGYKRIFQGYHTDLIEKAFALSLAGQGPVFCYIPVTPGVMDNLPRPKEHPITVAKRFANYLQST